MKRTIPLVLRPFAAGWMVISGLTVAVKFARHRWFHAPLNLWPCLFGAVLVLPGLTLFAKVSALARMLTDELDG